MFRAAPEPQRTEARTVVLAGLLMLLLAAATVVSVSLGSPAVTVALAAAAVAVRPLVRRGLARSRRAGRALARR
ncbi:hypothetical protein [Pseudonocardia spirodelae]|uniref:Uncharacterized protein n=1 Tax=Pseudonocardia spirodelae TaxID=3133431 RepID=A0ABU8T7V6_9PSEU